MTKVITIVVLLALAAISIYHAIWAREIRDRNLGRLERFHGKESRIFRLSSKWMGAAYVFSFRLVGAMGTVILVAAAIYVAIYE